MSAAALLQDDNDDEDVRLQDFYLRNIVFLKQVSISSIPSHILRKIAVRLHETLLFDSAWRDFAYNIGIEDNQILAEIEASAKVSKELPLFVALISTLQHDKKFGHIIEIFLQEKRLDILKMIQNFVEQFIKKHSTKVKRITLIEEQVCKNISEELESTAETVYHLNNLKIESESSKEFDLSTVKDNSKAESVKYEFDTLCQSSANIQEEVTFSQCKDLSIEVSAIIPSAPLQSENRLIILLQNTEYDYQIAEGLSTQLKQEGIVVKTLSDIDYLLLMDSVGALCAILQEVDFIVPIVSEKFLEQVFPRINVQYLESSDAMNNRCLYQLFMNEFLKNRCINFRVRPVLVPDINRHLVENDLILSKSLRLWKEVPKLVTVLKKTKALIRRYPFH